MEPTVSAHPHAPGPRRVPAGARGQVRSVPSIWQLPTVAAVYALYAERAGLRQAVFVGVADNLRERVVEQLVVRESPLGTGSEAVTLEPAFLTDLYWWEHADFADQHVLRAAEFMASDLFQPALRSRRPISARAAELYEDQRSQAKMAALLRAEATGHAVLPGLERILERLAELERRFESLALPPWERAGWLDA